MHIETPIDLYDILILQQIKLKHTSLDSTRFIFAPPTVEQGFRLAKTKFGQKIFPLLFVYRDTPAKPADEHFSPAKYAKSYYLDDDGVKGRKISVVNSYLNYKIAFYSNNMYDMNKFNMDFFRFQKNRMVEFDYSYLDINEKNTQEVMFESIEGENTIDRMNEIGLYFNWNYGIKIFVPLFDISNVNIATDIVLEVYEREDIPANLIVRLPENA